MPSTLVMLHELAKLLHYAQVEDVTLLRIGTSGGIGIDPGFILFPTFFD